MSSHHAWLQEKFLLQERKTNVSTEIRAGLATFLTMCYILLVNPQLLAKVTGENPETIVVSTALSSAVGCIATGYFGNMPFGLAPGIGLSTYLAYGLMMGQGLTKTEAFTSCFIASVILLIFSITGFSYLLMRFIPRSVKLATIVGMGMQIALVGMTSVKLVVPNKDTIVGLGDISNYQIWLAFSGLIIIGSLLFHQIEGAILIGILIMTFATWYAENSFPTQIIDFPNLTITPSNFIDFTNYDISKCFAGIAAFLLIGLIDVSGIIFGMSSLANITKEDGSIPGSTETFAAVSIASMFSAVTGGTPLIVYVESATGIKEGGRTGLTAIFVGIFFFLAIFIAPVLGSIPLTATAPVAILIGAMMMSQAEEIDWENMSDAIPAFLTLSIMPFTFSITNGIVFGLIAAMLFYITTGKAFSDLKELFGGRSEGGSEAELARLQPQSGNHQDNHHYVDTGRFVDSEPFVRAPSLILAKAEADAVRKARGMSVDERETNHGHNHSHPHHPHQTKATGLVQGESKFNYV
eukprot:gene12890-14123_t